MGTFVLVPGHYSGRWTWSRVIPLLSAKGHTVHAVALKGMGERMAELDATLGLATHIEDVSDFLVTHDLRDAIVVAHSYAGMVLEGVRRSNAGRIGTAVYLDAAVPRPGQALVDFMPYTAAELAALASPSGGVALPAPDPQVFGVTEAADRDWLRKNFSPAPLRTALDPLPESAQLVIEIPRVYVWCERSALSAATVGRIRQEPGWRVLTLDTDHFPMVTDPEALAAALGSLA